MEWILLFADDVTEISPTAAPWITSGLAGAILAWLFFVHLPNKDKLLTTLIEKKDEQIDEQRKEFTGTLHTVVKEFKDEAARERQACERHFGTLASTMEKSLDTLGRQLQTHSERNQQWIEMLKAEVESQKKEAEARKKETEALLLKVKS